MDKIVSIHLIEIYIRTYMIAWENKSNVPIIDESTELDFEND